MINAGDFKHRIQIIQRTKATDDDGFSTATDTPVASAWAKINTTKGYTIITQGSDFENALTRLLIRKPNVEISRKYLVLFRGKEWRIRYVNNVDLSDELIELQVEEVTING